MRHNVAKGKVNKTSKKILRRHDIVPSVNNIVYKSMRKLPAWGDESMLRHAREVAR